MKPVRLLPEARTELRHEVSYYSAARTGTGTRFRMAVESALARAAQHPLGGVPSPHGTHSMLVKGFPFSIVYRVSDAELLVVAVAPHRRHPGYWTSRIA